MSEPWKPSNFALQKRLGLKNREKMHSKCPVRFFSHRKWANLIDSVPQDLLMVFILPVSMTEVTSLVTSIADASRCLSNRLEEHRRQRDVSTRSVKGGLSVGSVTASLEATDGDLSDGTISASLGDDISISASSLSAPISICPSPPLLPLPASLSVHPHQVVSLR